MSSDPTYTWEEIAKHNTEADLWIVINDKVYDVTNYQLDHPGGPLVLLGRAGKNGSLAFEQASHSKNAIQNVMPKYYKGKIDTNSTMQEWQKEQPYTGPSMFVTILVVCVILAVVYTLAS